MRPPLFLYLILLLFLLLACQTGPPPVPEGPTMGDIPIISGAEALEREALPRGLVAVTQVHQETVQNPLIEHYQVEEPLLDTIEYYDKELRRLQWTLIDVLQFGDGGNLRRYHRGAQRAIVAFHPRGDTNTAFLLMQGTIR
jgi:hypothetical protein